MSVTSTSNNAPFVGLFGTVVGVILAFDHLGMETDTSNPYFDFDPSKCIVCSPFTVALMVGMSVTDVSQKAIANLGWGDIKMTHPLFVGDTLTCESKVLGKRESASRPGAGIVTVQTDGYNQDGKLVCTFTRTMLIAKQGHSIEDKVNY